MMSGFWNSFKLGSRRQALGKNMPENEPKDLVAEYHKSFSPQDKGQAILLLLHEYQDKSDQLSKEDQEILASKRTLLKEEIERGEQGDLNLIVGMISDIKFFLQDKLGCPAERLSDLNLMQLRRSYRITAENEGWVEPEVEPDLFAPPKKKEYKN